MAQQVLDAVQCIFDDRTTPTVRQQAHKLLEEVKESDACLDIGFELLRSSGPVSVQHCGIQLVEHVIRFKWNVLSSDERVEIKNRCFNSIAGLNENDCPHPLIMEGLARCVVEMVKREWPQAWPELIEECEKLCSLGTCQTEIVLFLFSRLVEDVMIFNSVEYQPQSKQLHNALILTAHSLLDLPLRIVELSSSFLGSSPVEKQNLSRLCLAALTLLSNTLHWVPAIALTSRMPKVLETLRLCLESTSLRLAKLSAACLNELATRKGSKKEAEPLLKLLTVHHIQPIVDTLRRVGSHEYEEETYGLFKSIVLLLVPIASTLATLWDYAEFSEDREPVLKLLLCTCLSLLGHPSLYARCMASQAMVVLAKRSAIVPSASYRTAYRDFLQIMPTAIAKIGMPSSSEEPYCTFSRADYDTNTEFLVDLTRMKECCFVIVREDVLYHYAPSYDFMLMWLRSVLCSPEQAAANSLFDCYCSVFTIICDSLLKLDRQTIEGLAETCISQLDMVMKAIDDHMSNPQCLDKLLSLVTGLFPLVPPTYWRIPEYLRSLISLLLVGDSEEWYCVNTHASHQLVKLSSTSQAVLLPHFNLLWNELQKIGEQLTDHMKCNMVDVLFELSNGLNSYEYQHSLTSACLSSTVEFWNSPSIVQAVSSPDNLLAYLGLYDPICTDPATDPSKVKRKQLLFHTSILSSIVNRISLDGNRQTLSDGGFTITDSGGTLRIRHPAFDTCEPLLPVIFRFARNINGIYHESCVKKIHPSYGGHKILDLLNTEKLTIMGNYNQARNDCGDENLLLRTSVEDHIRGFFSDITDNLFILIGRCACRFGWQFYTMPHASAMLQHGLLGNVEHCLDYRFHLLVRKALIPIMNRAQDECFPHLVNPLAEFFSHCYQRLSARWQLVLKNMDEALQEADRDLSDQEVFLEHMCSLMTRDVAALLRAVLVKRAEPKEKFENGSAPNEHEEEVVDQCALVDMSAMDIGGDLSYLGKRLQSSELGSFPSLVLLMFHMLSWQDSIPVLNISSLCHPVVVELLDKKLLDDSSTRHLFSCVLYGVQRHWQLDELLGKLLDLASKLYELFLAFFPNVCKEVLLSIPGTSREAVETFDEKMRKCRDGSMKIPDKVKRTMFKKLVKPIINPHMEFKREPQFRELPPLLRPPSVSTVDLHSESDLRFLFGGS